MKVKQKRRKNVKRVNRVFKGIQKDRKRNEYDREVRQKKK